MFGNATFGDPRFKVGQQVRIRMGEGLDIPEAMQGRDGKITDHIKNEKGWVVEYEVQANGVTHNLTDYHIVPPLETVTVPFEIAQVTEAPLGKVAETIDFEAIVHVGTGYFVAIAQTVSEALDALSVYTGQARDKFDGIYDLTDGREDIMLPGYDYNAKTWDLIRQHRIWYNIIAKDAHPMDVLDACSALSDGNPFTVRDAQEYFTP